MPVTINIREDLRYQQGWLEGKLESIEEESSKIAASIAKKLLQDGVAIATIQNWTGLEITEIKKIASELLKNLKATT